MCQYRPRDPASLSAPSVSPSAVLNQAERRTHVGVLLGQHGGPPLVLGATQAGLGALSQVEVETGVGAGHRVALIGVGELLGGVLHAASRACGTGCGRPARSATTSERRTSRSNKSSTDAGDRSSPATTCSAASSVQPPRNTASRRNSTRSPAVSRSWLQSTVARRVCWRASAVRTPVVRTENRSLTRVGQLGGAEAGQPGRGELQSERDAVQAPADDGDGRQRVGVHDEIRGGGQRTVDEQLGGGERPRPRPVASRGRGPVAVPPGAAPRRARPAPRGSSR